MTVLGDEIAGLVINEFQKTQLKGKPQVKSNGMREWTVLAGIVAIHGIGEDYSLNLIAITTGVKLLPDEFIRKHSYGKLLHDCHAEILVLRAFNRFITSECLKNQSHYVEKVDGMLFKLKSEIEFALYVSEPPCGDCSLELLHDANEQGWDDVAILPDGVIRGRDNYKLVGRVRTKPGRRDSLISLSKSCSDKLCLMQKTSMLNCVVSSFMDFVFLRYLIVPEDKYNADAFQRCFRDRFVKDGSRHFETLTTTLKHEWEARDGTVPSNRSLIYIPNEQLQESIVNSMKEGFYSKKTYMRPNGESKLSRYQLWNHAMPLIINSEYSTYLEFKQSQSTYQTTKVMAQSELQHWCKTATDNFDI